MVKAHANSQTPPKFSSTLSQPISGLNQHWQPVMNIQCPVPTGRVEPRFHSHLLFVIAENASLSRWKLDKTSRVEDALAALMCPHSPCHVPYSFF